MCQYVDVTSGEYPLEKGYDVDVVLRDTLTRHVPNVPVSILKCTETPVDPEQEFGLVGRLRVLYKRYAHECLPR